MRRGRWRPCEEIRGLTYSDFMTDNVKPLGTVAAVSSGDVAAEHYHDCFARDFSPSTLLFIADDRPEIVHDFAVASEVNGSA